MSAAEADGKAVTELLDRARRDVDRGWLPACQVAVARHGELVAFETFGDATDTTRFAAYSCTKPIVAAAIWQLLGEGAVSLDQPIGDLVPELAHPSLADATLEHVLLHTAGFPDAPMAPTEGAGASLRRARFGTWHAQWAPGSRFEYHTGSAHWVLVDLLERVDGIDFRDAVERRVTAPLGLPRVLGIPVGDQAGIAPPVRVGAAVDDPTPLPAEALADPDAIAAGVPGGGGIMTAASLATFYQALLDPRGDGHDGLWHPDVLADATSNVRCRLPEPLFGLPVNRTIGLVVAGDDGQHVMRYAGFGAACSPASFGHAGMHMQVGWADPATGISFAYLTNGIDSDTMREGMRGVALADLAARV